MSAHVPGSPSALRERAHDLDLARGAVQHVIGSLDASSHALARAGQNAYVELIGQSILAIRVDLGDVRDALSEAAGIFNDLAAEIERIQAEDNRDHGLSELGAPLLAFNRHHDEAMQARQAAAHALRRLEKKLDRQSPPDDGGNFFTHLWDDTVGDLVDGVKNLWGLTGEVLFDSKETGEHWKQLGDGYGQLVDGLIHHRDATLGALWDGVTDKEDRDKDPFAWGVGMVLTLGIGKALKLGVKAIKLEDVLKGARGADLTETSRLLGRFPALRSATIVLDDIQVAMGAWDPDNHFRRGFNVENLLAAERIQSEGSVVTTEHLYSTHPTIDMWNRSLGKVTSIKSIDPALPTYANSLPVFRSQLESYRDKLDTYNPQKINGVDVTTRDFRVKELQIALPSSGLSHEQASFLDHFVQESKDMKINVTLTEVPR